MKKFWDYFFLFLAATLLNMYDGDVSKVVFLPRSNCIKEIFLDTRTDQQSGFKFVLGSHFRSIKSPSHFRLGSTGVLNRHDSLTHGYKITFLKYHLYLGISNFIFGPIMVFDPGGRRNINSMVLLTQCVTPTRYVLTSNLKPISRLITKNIIFYATEAIVLVIFLLQN